MRVYAAWKMVDGVWNELPIIAEASAFSALMEVSTEPLLFLPVGVQPLVADRTQEIVRTGLGRAFFLRVKAEEADLP